MVKKEFPQLKIIDYVHMEEMGWRAGGYARTSAVVSDIIDKTYVCNDHLRELMIQTFNRKQSDVETLYIGVDIDEYNPAKYRKFSIKEELGISSERPVVLFPCRIAEQKRPFLMIAIAKEVIKKIPNIAFFVVGDGPQLEGIRHKIENEKLGDNVYLLGRQNDMKPFYRDSDLTLICSIREGLALTAYESLAMGVPVISSDVGGQKELVDDKVGRLLPFLQERTKFIDIEVSKEYSQNEINQYVEAIESLLRNNDQYNTISKNAREKIIAKFDKNNMIRTLEVELVNLLNNKFEDEEVHNLKSLSNLIDDYLTLYCEFLQREADLEWIWNERNRYNLDIRSNDLNNVNNNSITEAASLLELQKIYNMRSWKLIVKYQDFMDNSRIGLLLSKLRNFILKFK